MAIDFLRRVTERVVRQWNRGDLNKKFVELARELLVSKEKNLQLEKKNLELVDEIRRLKGEQARPKFKKKINKRDTSELNHKNDDEDPPRGSKRVKDIPIDEEVEVDLDINDLPKDARFIGTVERVIQNLELKRKNIKFIFKRYYSPSEKKTFIGEVEGLDGSRFGSDLRAFIDYLYYKLRVPHEKIRGFLSEFDIDISKGQLEKLLNKDREDLEEELDGARKASLKKSSCHHLDETGHKLNNEDLYTFCFSNIYMTYLRTFSRKTKVDAMITVFGSEKYCINKWALSSLKDLLRIVNLSVR